MNISASIASTLAASLLFAGSAALADPAGPAPKKPARASEPSSCLSQTGSRIKAPGACRGTGRSYTAEDVQRTGANNVGDALRLLDPSIVVHR